MKAVKIAGFATLLALTSAFAQDAAPQMEKKSSLWAEGSLDVSSGYIYDSGSVLSDTIAVQPFGLFGFDAFDVIPVNMGFWGNWATSRANPEQTQKHCFTEVDMFFGTGYEFDNGFEISLTLNTYQYPNMEGWNGEESLLADLSQKVCEGLTVGSEFELYLSGDTRNNFVIVPYAKYEFQITDVVSASVKAQCQYQYNPGEDVDAWTAYFVNAGVSAYSFTVYATYFGQISDKIYTDEIHDMENVVYGVSYAFEL